ncbi:gamma-glutamyl-gamma-aminobutyrate hydrolase family protein [Candidatus Endoriftia persephone]|jgi:putative glutamine amidotransferase|uniref:Peptidase C26 n=3 Tax=Gammaproteobacteria TaxID=1236 RepID=G2DE32_9GAMM|nr:gamma-glutamyl-gamma-aminobutyrate hydrolase family protein [Candidatus Endoriftia persephone]EGV51102.1 peptidase C26 [endosymbiont of Riftia pachyptila (vent Ph05)]EGW54277.1 putative glutamine amidotransferase [endosymbiont of Tevnia jerichonana (vent Tica)]USF87424.1 gamma-glutamyl-gamma-aminobutyrate hydrolase family protein [Candidatus Endoriftia persephone]
MSKPKPPLIGITAANDPRMPEHYLLRWDYVRGVVAAGGIPVILAPTSGLEIKAVLARIDALVLSGGGDIDPASYGGNARIKPLLANPERDQFELELVKRALDLEMPLLGICRGMQVINVACGGDLIQDIEAERQSPILHDDPLRPRDRIAHEVSILPGTSLFGMVRRERIAVNSFHHQAVDQLGAELRISALADDDLVEAIEHPQLQFVMGVQWHPESLCSLGAPFSTLFDEVTRQASRMMHA